MTGPETKASLKPYKFRELPTQHQCAFLASITLIVMAFALSAAFESLMLAWVALVVTLCTWPHHKE